jgi:ABC-2 type transport system ATP-binding protein
VALIDRGCVVAIDTPSALAAAAGKEQSIRFRPSPEVDPGLILGLTEVSTVERHGSQLIVTGTGNLLGVVITALTQQGIVAEDLRVDQSNLEDAFVALTRHDETETMEVTR